MKNSKTLNLARKIVYIFFTVHFSLFTFNSFSQGVAINPTGGAADNSAMLDVSATNQGMRIPRVALTSTTSALPITNPANSLLVYDSVTAGDVTPGFYYWDGSDSKWVRFSTGSGSGWSTSGNSGTDTATNFIGTTDDRSWVMKTNNFERMKISKTGNIGIGTSNPASSAILDVSSTTKGVRMPNMTTNQRNLISSPATGLQIYNTDCGAVDYYNGSCWISMSKALPDPKDITSNPASTSFCEGQIRTYTIPAVTGANYYTWSVPAGSTINSGQGTTSLIVSFGSISGSVCVKAGNDCETSGQTCISVNLSPLADTPGGITGLNSVYPNQTSVTYSITGSGSYTWTVPTGSSIISGQGTNSIIVNYSCSAISGNISVAGSNSCGLGSASSLAVTVSPVLAAFAGNNINQNTYTTSNAIPIASSAATGGVGPYTYSWSSSPGSFSSTSLSPTPPSTAYSIVTYTLVATDTKGCTATSSMLFTWGQSGSPTTFTDNITANTLSWTVPTGITSITIRVWGAGGAGSPNGQYAGGSAGGGGGGYGLQTYSVTPGNTYVITVGAGGGSSNCGSLCYVGYSGGASSVVGPSISISATGGSTPASLNAGGAGGTSAASTNISGGNGGNGLGTTSPYTSGNGGNGGNGGAGGIGTASFGTVNNGAFPGGGGSGNSNKTGNSVAPGGSGADGSVTISW